MDYFWYYLTTVLMICCLSALFLVYRYYLGNRLIEQSQKLKSQIAKIRQDFPELEQRRGEIVASAIGDIGIEGIMNELGIDPKLLNNPLVKGLIDKYAPRLLETLNKQTKGGTNAPQQIEGF